MENSTSFCIRVGQFIGLWALITPYAVQTSLCCYTGCTVTQGIQAHYLHNFHAVSVTSGGQVVIIGSALLVMLHVALTYV
jgi:hypothetical protein